MTLLRVRKAKILIVIIAGAILYPSFAFAEGQDWMMAVDNAIYLFKLLAIYLLISTIVYWGIKKMFDKVVTMRIVFLATIIVALVHWQVTKDKPLSGAIENYSNTDDIDTTIIGNPTK